MKLGDTALSLQTRSTAENKLDTVCSGGAVVDPEHFARTLAVIGGQYRRVYVCVAVPLQCKHTPRESHYWQGSGAAGKRRRTSSLMIACIVAGALYLNMGANTAAQFSSRDSARHT
jgi:hypothetical protein